MKKAKAKTKPAPKKRKKVAPIPAGYHAVTPYLSIRGAAQALEFYKKAFGAKEIMRMPGPDGKLGHAEIRIGGSRIMLADEYPQMNILSPQARGGTTVSLYLYVGNADATVERAVAAGAKLLRPVADQFYGDRTGTIEDPFGHMWHVGTHKEDLSKAELRKRAEKAMAAGSGG
jgi:PhnB protein